MDKKRINLEIKILKNTYHYNIIKIYEVIDTKDTICMIMEYAEGGELFNYILERKYLSEDESRKIFQQLIDAISYLHQIGICHRDLKLENILFSSIKKDYIKIIDFGLSNLYLTGVSSDNPSLAFGADFLETPCGSPGYVPPEMILGCKYDGLISDIWSAGIILYSMLCGTLPFDDPNEEKLYSKIIKGEFYFPSDINISDEAKTLIKKILVVNPRLRANIKDIRNDPWFLNDYKPILGLFISIRDIPICNDIIEDMEKYGLNKNEIIDNVKNNRHNKITTIYYLLVNKYRNEGKETINDLISNSFNEYLKEQDLKNKLIKKGEKPISLKIMKYRSKSIFDSKEEVNEDDNFKKFDLEYLKSLIHEDILTNIEDNNEDNNKKEEKSIKKEKNDKINIHTMKSKIEKIDDKLKDVIRIKSDDIQNKPISRKTRKDRSKKNDKFSRGEYSLKEKNIKNINILDFNSKCSNSTSLNKKKKNKKNTFDYKYKNKIISNKSDFEQSKKKLNEKKINNDNVSKNIKKINIKPNKGEEKIINKNVPKIPKLSLNKKINTKLNLNLNYISNNKINSLINKDILTTINNSNLKINKIRKIKENNIKNIINKKVKNKKYYELFNKGIKSRNYYNMELNNEIKTTRQSNNKYALKSSSNSKSKSKSPKCKSLCSTERNKNEIITYNISNKNKNKDYFNIKINNRNTPLLTEGNKYSFNKYSLLNKENKKSKNKSNTVSVSKTKFKNKIKSNDISSKHKKYNVSKDKNLDKTHKKKETFSTKRKNDSLQKGNTDYIKNINCNTMKKLEINNLNNFKIKNKRNIFEEINSNVNNIKSILTDRNNHINNIINNKKYDFIENNNLNNKKVKMLSRTLQKIIPSLKGLTIKEKKPLIKKSLINLIDGSNPKGGKKPINNLDLLKKMNKNKIIKKLDINIKKDKEININLNKNKMNNKSNNNIGAKIRKISPINQNSKLISISNNSNYIENSKTRIKPIKLKGIKSIKIYNNSNYANKSKTSRTINNNDRIINNDNFQNKFYDEFNNFGFKTFNKENQENSNNYRNRLNFKKNYKNYRNLNEMLISILTKNKINVIKTDNNEYICKKGNNKMILELKKYNNMDNYYISINNVNTSQKEFELFKKQIINIFNSN